MNSIILKIVGLPLVEGWREHGFEGTTVLRFVIVTMS